MKKRLHIINTVRMQHPEEKLVCGSYKSFTYVLSDLSLANAPVSAFRLFETPDWYRGGNVEYMVSKYRVSKH